MSCGVEGTDQPEEGLGGKGEQRRTLLSLEVTRPMGVPSCQATLVPMTPAKARLKSLNEARTPERNKTKVPMKVMMEYEIPSPA